MNSSNKTSGAGKSGLNNRNAIELLKADHREVDQLFEQFKTARGRQQRKKLIGKIGTALNAHTIIEEEIFYPACSEHGIEEDDLDEAQVEHDTIKLLVRELIDGSLDDDYYDAKVTVLSEYVKHHVEEEEDPEKGIFVRVEKTDIDLSELGQELEDRKDELMEDEQRLRTNPPRIRSLHLSTPPTRHADDRGRRSGVSSENDHSSGANTRGRQEEYGNSNSPKSADRQHEGHGGWHGDAEGHSEAARRGWRHRDH